MVPAEIISYLMDGDHAIRWQVLDQLSDGSAETIHHERMMIELEGWGKELLDLQDNNGLWNMSLIHLRYNSTLWVLVKLKRLGIYPLDNFYLACEKLVQELTFDGAVLWEGTRQKHTCLAGLSLMVLCYFRYLHPTVEAIYHYLIETQRDDGTWRCEHHGDEETAVYSTTLAVLEGLEEYQKIYRQDHNRICDMQRLAHEFLLNRHLYFKGTSTTEVFHDFTDYPFPYLHYDLMTILDYFQRMGMRYDMRMSEALLEIKKASWNGRWRMQDLPFPEYVREPENGFSRFNTLRGTRILDHFQPFKI